MSHAASIRIQFANAPKPATDVLEALLADGWSYDDHGDVAYLPQGDDESFDWQRAPVTSWPEIWDLLHTKTENKEGVGLVLLHTDGRTGGEFWMPHDSSALSASWSVNRRELFEGAATDHSWYLQRILPTIFRLGLTIEEITCLDIS